MRVLIVALLLLISGTALATGLGRVLEPVADRSTGAREEALVSALEKVLVRLTGSRFPGQIEGVDSILRQPSRWARQYAYVENSEDQPADGSADQSADALSLSVDFDTGALTARLEEMGAPVWSTQRPTVLLWAVLQRPAYGELLSGRADDAVARDLLSQADARGLPLLLPRMDSTDLAQISPADVRGRFDRVIDRASSRYQAPMRATAVIYTGEPVRVRWRLLDSDIPGESGEFQVASEAEAVSALVDAITGVMVQRYAVAGGEATARTVRVDGVGSLASWQGLERYLTALAGVRDVQMKAVDGQTVFFELMFAGPATQLQHLVEVNPRLQQCASPRSDTPQAGAGQAASDASEGVLPVAPVLVYCWQERP